MTEDENQCCTDQIKVLLRPSNLPVNPDCVVLRICISLRPPDTFGSSKQNKQNTQYQETHHKKRQFGLQVEHYIIFISANLNASESTL